MNINTFNIVLYEPEIPQNTGKLGFSLSDKYMKRSGLDYWEHVSVKRINTLDELKAQYPNSNFYYLTTKSKISFYDVKFEPEDFLVFGPESRGIPEDILFAESSKSITIPMKENMRSLNLSNSVAIVLYEAIRQVG